MKKKIKIDKLSMKTCDHSTTTECRKNKSCDYGWSYVCGLITLPLLSVRQHKFLDYAFEIEFCDIKIYRFKKADT
jgi:hypothetical protein